MVPFGLIVSSELPKKQPFMTGPSRTGGSHMPALPPVPYTYPPPHSNGHTYGQTPAPHHNYQTNPQPVGWVHDPILRDNYGAAPPVTLTDANAQQYRSAEARILVGDLSMNCGPEVLRDQLKGVFPQFGLN
ncbi:hypothetical protein BJY00DRAFT_280892 [Aspergillus carlsbadensis]|nr:hypothetical protein BJY00DRAFT_280892 [Aspergillus carlsbadensis]